jgi:PAS domain-containing protein
VRFPKDRLASLLWSDRAETQARSSLRQALLELRLALNETNDVICSDREHIWVREDSFTDDTHDNAEAPRDAFEDLDDITPEFDEWLTVERSRRAARRMAALKAEAECLLNEGLPRESTLVADKIRRLDQCDEDGLRLGMKAAFQLGHPAEIARRYEATAAVLKNELGVEPASESRDLRDSLLSELTVVNAANGSNFGELYSAAEKGLNMGAWDCNLLTGELYWTPGTFYLFEMPVGASLRRADIIRMYEPESRERLEIARATAIRNRTGFTLEVDVICGTGAKRRLLINAAVATRNGKAIRLFGTKQRVH